jgi:hypothetical protein
MNAERRKRIAELVEGLESIKAHIEGCAMKNATPSTTCLAARRARVGDGSRGRCLGRSRERTRQRFDQPSIRGDVVAVMTQQHFATASELADTVLAYINEYDNASWAELANRWPDHFSGGPYSALVSSDAPNVVYWVGLSELAAEALPTIRAKTDLQPCSRLVYMIDGRCLRFPLVNGRSIKVLKGYKRPHWAPTVFRKRRRGPLTTAELLGE